jgi:DNA-directed RNA polymerase specialized sigma24 family protein
MTANNANREGSPTAFASDSTEFWRIISPLQEELKDAARRELNYMTAAGNSADSITPEELVDEVLEAAWENRHQKPAGLEVKTWLLALMYQRLDRFGAADESEAVEEIHLPDEEIEEIIPDPGPTPEEIVLMLEKEPLLLDQDSRRALLMHDVYGISIRQIGALIGKPPREIAIDLVRARRTVRPRDTSEFRIGDRVRVKATGIVDYVADVLPLPDEESQATARRYVLLQDMGRSEAYASGELQLIERGDAWALAEHPDPHRDHGR